MAEDRVVSPRDVAILAEIAEQYSSIPPSRFEALLAELSEPAKDIARALVNRLPASDPLVDLTAQSLRQWAKENRLPLSVEQ
jgi:hypothetical protein